MNRRKFLRTTTAVAVTASILPRSTLAADSKGVHWLIGCFNRPWHEKTDWGFDTALGGIKAAGYKIIGLLRTGANEPLAGPDATEDYLKKLKQRVASHGLKVNMAALRTGNNSPLED